MGVEEADLHRGGGDRRRLAVLLRARRDGRDGEAQLLEHPEDLVERHHCQAALVGADQADPVRPDVSGVEAENGDGPDVQGAVLLPDGAIRGGRGRG